MNIEPHIYSRKGFKETVEIMTVDPENLLTPYRFDVVAKYIYAWHKEHDVAFDFAKNLYLDHLKVWNAFQERNNGKTKPKDFLYSFDSTIDSVKQHGFDADTSVIPVGEHMVAINGGHRVAAALCFNTPVTVAKANTLEPVYDYKMFEKKGLSRTYLDYMALQYCRLKPNSFLAVVFPIVYDKLDTVRDILGAHGVVFYEKQVALTRTGVHNLVLQMYKDASWINDGVGAAKHSFHRYVADLPVTIVGIEAGDVVHMKEAKKKIRSLFSHGNYPIHITDTQEESVRLAEQLFNENSVHLLNVRTGKNDTVFRKLFPMYKQMISDSKYNKDRFCIDSGAVLSLYGLRETRDIDYLSLDNVKSSINKIEDHKVSLHLYEKNIDELLFDPFYHLYHDGYKAVSLSILKKMKKRRGEKKDQRDVHLIDSILMDPSFLQRLFRWAWYAILLLPNRIRYVLKRLLPQVFHPYLKRMKRAINNWNKS